MGRLTKVYVCLLFSSVLFAAWGLARWLQAQALTVEAPAPVAVKRGEIQPQRGGRLSPLSRYAGLQVGELFFGPQPPPSPEAVKVKVEFSSQLLLYGVTKGTTRGSDRAIVGLTADPTRQTWLVRAGSVVNGETIVKIEEKGVWVKNATGEGKVGVKGE